jgi:ADP-ribose pyrophosphatase
MSQSGPVEKRAPIPSCLLGASLPVPPRIEVTQLREVARASTRFLTLRELELQNRYADGTQSAPYLYSLTERVLLDAVALVLFRRTEKHGYELVLRTQLRPPLAFRGDYDVPLRALGTGAVQWEIPAGLIELGERGEDGIAGRASAEALEEVGVKLAPERFSTLGPPSSLSPGLIAEKLHFVCAEILDTDHWEPAAGDGHAVEEHSTSLFVPLPVALRALDEGMIHDVKTELGIGRLLRHLAQARGEAARFDLARQP